MSHRSVSTRAAVWVAGLQPNWPRKSRYSQAVRSRETIRVPCRSNGEITVNAYHPLKSSPSGDATSRVLIYVPRGPLLGDEEQEAANIAQLSRHLSGHYVIRINYRLGQQHPYPTPVHDTLTGFDWIVENILPKRAISRPGRANHVGRIAVCGELVGGGLASMLALTECRVGELGITAAAVNSPVVDWVSLEIEDAESKTNSATDKLLRLRDRLFSKPDRYFDPLASPMLLFRTPGSDVPPGPSIPPLDDMAQLSLLEREEHVSQRSSGVKLDQDEAFLYPPELSVPPSTPRKASRRFPSASLNLRLPAFHISTGSTPPLSDQAEELAHVLRQSFIRQSRQAATGSSFGRKVLLEDEEDDFEDDNEKRTRQQQKLEAEKKAQLHRHDGQGLWDGSREGQARLERVARWLGEEMR